MSDEEREVNVQLLLAYVFKQWRKILIITLICGLLGAAYYCVKTLPSYNNMQKTYKQGVTTYETSKASLSADKQKTQDYIDYLTNYSKNSIKTNIDPYNEVRTVMTISTVTSTGQDDFQALLSGTNHANQITQAYAAFINSSIDYSPILESLNIDEKSLKEIVSASTNFDVDMVTVIVIGTSADQTEMISKYILTQTTGYVDTVKSKYGDHSAVFSEPITSTVTDGGLLTAVSDKMLSPNSAMNDALTKINTLKTTLATQQKSIDALKQPSTVSSIILHGLSKNLFIGLGGGFVGIIILLCISIVISGKVLSEDDLEEVFHITTLGIIPMRRSSKRNKKFDRFIYRKIDSSYNTTFETAIEKALTNIKVCSTNCKSVVLIAVNTKINVLEVQTKLQELDADQKYICTADVNANAEELKKLNNADAVIIIAERNSSKIADLSKAIETINIWKKPVIGSILL